MHDRCRNENHEAYHRYGGRGIKVCGRWSGPEGFPSFVTDVGDKPAGTTLERRDNDGPYSPENCYWATGKQQNRNRCNNRLITYDGRTACAAQWADDLGVARKWLMNQLRYRSLAEVATRLLARYTG